MDDDTIKNALTITIRERDKIVRQETVKAISSANDKGVFDVLPMHVNFVSLIREFLVIHKEGGAKEEIKIEPALMHVFKNKVSVYLGLQNRELEPDEKTPEAT